MESKIVGYRGIANGRTVIVSGHAFEKHKVRAVHPRHGKRKNLRQTLRRFRAQPLKWTAIDVIVGGQSRRVHTNKRGFFTCEVQHALSDPGWYSYDLFWKRNNKSFTSEFYLSDDHETGVISDIDDTLLISHSTLLLRKVALMLFRNAYTRKVIPFIGDWHAYLREMNNANHPSDFFYVSNSEWNLYDFLTDFFLINDLPKGVFFLQDLKKGLREIMTSGKKNSHHKLQSIEFLLRYYPYKKFILAGDSGQHDMQIYLDVASRFPGRISGVMIRDLSFGGYSQKVAFYKDQFARLSVPFKTIY